MNIPQSTIDPFGYIGIPSIKPTRDDEAIDLIIKTVIDWYKHIDREFLLNYSDSVSMSTKHAIEKHAIALGATYANFKRNHLERGHVLFFVVSDIQFRVLLK